MNNIMTAEQMRWVDQQTIEGGTPGSVLMERAGRAVGNAVLQCRSDSGRIVIVAGPGNNGGDGYAASRVLAEQNMKVTVVTLSDPEDLEGDAVEHARLAQHAGVKIRCCVDDIELLRCWLARAVIVVDAIFGTGIVRPLTDQTREAVECINASGRPVLSVDMPSGIHSDTGEVMGVAVQAGWTLPIATTKWGHWLGAGRDFAVRFYCLLILVYPKPLSGMHIKRSRMMLPGLSFWMKR